MLITRSRSRCAITLGLVVTTASIASSGCSSRSGQSGPESGEERVSRTSAAIVGGTSSEAARDFAVMLVFSDPSTNRRGICTAALIAPRLVLTARHCVSETDLDVACAADGSATLGGTVRANHDARMLTVFAGRDRPDLDPARAKPSGRGLEILDDGAKNLCNHDLALVLLEKPIDGVRLASIRLDGDAEDGESLTTIGWGVTTSTLEPGTRQERTGVIVTRVGPDDRSPVLAPSEFTFGESICLGDSGGPIVSTRTGAIVGVVSRGGNGSSSSDPADTCTSATNLGTKLGPFRELLTRSFSRAGAEPQLEERAADEDSGCSIARTGMGTGPSSSPARVATLVLLSLLLITRRRSA